MRSILSLLLSLVCVILLLSFIADDIQGRHVETIEVIITGLCGIMFAWDFYVRTKQD